MRNTHGPADATPRPALGRAVVGLATWSAVALALIVGSGAARSWQARRVESALDAGRERQFKLDEIPLNLGDWVGEKSTLDEQIVKATGSDDLITRRYVDRRTGVSLDVIILYGPTSEVFIHAPELCYPKAGFETYDASTERVINFGDIAGTFRSVAYAKGDPSHRDIQDIYYSWRYNGQWTPTIGSPKQLERIPGMYKVQVARSLTRTESRADERDPCESFLRVLIPDLESRITGATPPPTPPASRP